jgi:hypothetical protein
LRALTPHYTAAAAADHGASLEASDKMRLLMSYIATHPERSWTQHIHMISLLVLLPLLLLLLLPMLLLLQTTGPASKLATRCGY